MSISCLHIFNLYVSNYLLSSSECFVPACGVLDKRLTLFERQSPPFCKIGSLTVCHMADVRVTIRRHPHRCWWAVADGDPCLQPPLCVCSPPFQCMGKCVFGNQGRAEGGGEPEKDRKGVQRLRCSQERGESCGTQSLSELLKDDL